MRKRKFTYRDSQPWIVVDTLGQQRSFYYHDQHGRRVTVRTFDGFRSANNAAQRFGGTAIRQ